MNVFLDTGITNNVFKKNARFENFKKSLSSIHAISSQSSYYFVSHPLMLIEYVNDIIRPTPCHFPNLETFIRDNAEDFNDEKVGDLLEIAMNELKKSPDLQYEVIKKSYERNLTYKIQQGREIADLLFRENLDPKTHETFIWQLAIDLLQKIEFKEFLSPEEYRKNYIKMPIALARIIIKSDYNMSISRTFNRFFIEVQKENAIKAFGGNIPQNVIEDLDNYNKRLSYDDAEAVDPLLIHFAVFGNKLEKKISPVMCFTTEKKLNTKFSLKIEAYISFLEHLNKTIEISYMPGFIVSIDPETGSECERIIISDLVSKYRSENP